MLNSLPVNLVTAPTLAPAADAAGRNGTAVSLKNAHKAWIVYHIDQGNAATIALAPEQCSAVAGTGAKAIPAVPIWTNQDFDTATPLAREATDAASFTTSAAVKKKLVIFEIDPAKLDMANGFDWKSHAPLQRAVTEAEKELAGRGRVLIRASGTEPVLRVMVEAQKNATARSLAETIATTLR